MSKPADIHAAIRWLIPRVIFLLLLGLFCSSSCVSTIYPPDHVDHACTIYLLKESRHRGIVLPGEGNSFVEYGYGDWDWYALMKDRWYHVFDTVLWPTRGCLGRRFTMSLPARELYPLVVDREKAKRLLAELNHRFEQQRKTEWYNRTYDILFVHDDNGFWMFHNCSDSVAEWMERLDCRVSWAPIRWDIDTLENISIGR